MALVKLDQAEVSTRTPANAAEKQEARRPVPVGYLGRTLPVCSDNNKVLRNICHLAVSSNDPVQRPGFAYILPQRLPRYHHMCAYGSLAHDFNGLLESLLKVGAAEWPTFRRSAHSPCLQEAVPIMLMPPC